MLGPDGVRYPLAKFEHAINVYLNSSFAVTSQATKEMAKNEPLASNLRGVICCRRNPFGRLILALWLLSFRWSGAPS